MSRASSGAPSPIWSKPPPEQAGVLHGEALPVVVEVDVYVGARAPGGDPPRPGLELGAGVVAAASAVTVVEADQGPVAGQLALLEGPARVVADHERHAVLPQQVVDRGLEPALVAKLEAVAAGRQLGHSAGKQLVVALEVRRQLPDDGAELARLHERLDPLVVADHALADVAQAPDVRQLATGLDAEDEVLGRVLHPAGHGVPGGQPVE